MIYYNEKAFFMVLGIIIIIGFVGAVFKIEELWTFSFGLLLGILIDSLLTKEQIELIKKLKEEGKTTYELAKQFNVCQNTIMYWTSNRDKQIKRNSERIKNMSKEERHKIYLKQYEYRKNYFKSKYQTDSEFRKKVIERVIKYQKRKKNEQSILL